VDLATMPIYVRAGAILPLGPIKQYTDEPSDEPLTLLVYPGANGASALYEDDGISFNHRRGEWMRVALAWRDATRTLALRLAPGSRMLPPAERRMVVRVAGTASESAVTFRGRPLEVKP
jgi:uncharacterized protein DUF5110